MVLTAPGYGLALRSWIRLDPATTWWAQLPAFVLGLCRDPRRLRPRAVAPVPRGGWPFAAALVVTVEPARGPVRDEGQGVPLRPARRVRAPRPRRARPPRTLDAPPGRARGRVGRRRSSSRRGARRSSRASWLAARRRAAGRRRGSVGASRRAWPRRPWARCVVWAVFLRTLPGVLNDQLASPGVPRRLPLPAARRAQRLAHLRRLPPRRRSRYPVPPSASSGARRASTTLGRARRRRGAAGRRDRSCRSSRRSERGRHRRRSPPRSRSLVARRCSASRTGCRWATAGPTRSCTRRSSCASPRRCALRAPLVRRVIGQACGESSGVRRRSPPCSSPVRWSSASPTAAVYPTISLRGVGRGLSHARAARRRRVRRHVQLVRLVLLRPVALPCPGRRDAGVAPGLPAGLDQPVHVHREPLRHPAARSSPRPRSARRGSGTSGTRSARSTSARARRSTTCPWSRPTSPGSCTPTAGAAQYGSGTQVLGVHAYAVLFVRTRRRLAAVRGREERVA